MSKRLWRKKPESMYQQNALWKRQAFIRRIEGHISTCLAWNWIFLHLLILFAFYAFSCQTAVVTVVCLYKETLSWPAKSLSCTIGKIWFKSLMIKVPYCRELGILAIYVRSTLFIVSGRAISFHFQNDWSFNAVEQTDNTTNTCQACHWDLKTYETARTLRACSK